MAAKDLFNICISYTMRHVQFTPYQKAGNKKDQEKPIHDPTNEYVVEQRTALKSQSDLLAGEKCL